MYSVKLHARLSPVLTLALLTVLVTPVLALAHHDITDVTELRAFMDEAISAQMDAHNISAVTLSVVQDGEIVLAQGYGYADLDEGTPVDPERSLFRPGSISKLFTWTAVMQLAEQGQLDLEADINEYLDFDIPNRLLTGNSDPEPITMRHLMTHTPGFEDVGEELFVLSVNQLTPLDQYLQNNLPARVFPPGTVLAYSNYGSALAGYIVEQISGLSFDDYIEQNIFTPLNISASTFRQPLPDDLAPHMVRAFRYANGQYYEGSFEYIPPFPAGSMSCTSVDMAKFMIAHLREGRYGNERILDPDTVQEMQRQQFTHHPAVDGVTLGLFEHTVNGITVLSHSGGTMRFSSQLFLLSDHDMGLFVSYGGGDDRLWNLPADLFQAFMNHYFPHSDNQLPEPPPDIHERAGDYVGEYHPARISYTGPDRLIGLMQAIGVDINEEGYLTGNFMGQRLEFIEVEPGVYKNATPEKLPIETVAFTNGPGGRPLLSAGASTYIKAPWYGTLAFLGGLTLFAFILMLLTIIGWLLAFMYNRISKKQTVFSGRGKKIARMVAVAVSLTTIVLFVGLAAILLTINPAYGVPDIVFGVMTPWMHLIFALPWLLVPLGIAMFVSTVAVWRYGYWSTLTRVHYTLLAISLLGLFWVLHFTNMFSWLAPAL